MVAFGRQEHFWREGYAELVGSLATTTVVRRRRTHLRYRAFPGLSTHRLAAFCFTAVEKRLPCRISRIDVVFGNSRCMSHGCTNLVRGQDATERVLERLSEEQAMAEVQRSNGDAFTVPFDRYHPLVLVSALKIVRDVREAQEVNQSISFEIDRAARRFDPLRRS